MIRTSAPLVKSSAGMRPAFGGFAGVCRAVTTPMEVAAVMDELGFRSGFRRTEVMGRERLIAHFQEQPMNQFQRDQSVDLGCVVAIALEMAGDNGFDTGPLQKGT